MLVGVPILNRLRKHWAGPEFLTNQVGSRELSSTARGRVNMSGLFGCLIFLLKFGTFELSFHLVKIRDLKSASSIS
ncbi:hypothetical protein AKJ45_03415 [candidate division MSBL1 archaeon SCGC-AAA261F19]|uniref:Uncharacterized protein n=1 Tax=candidate division MSBL1 archaeon SCGC-AAA261F19 TaxID=1698275 RepID=A0A133V826_9EURY|nr:hypothetical protein AKJ45_03415 [candidate division MSBL1 archaeon SCGC-AAA261F19]